MMPVRALPFAISFTFVPVMILGLTLGGWWVIASMVYAFLVIPFFDQVFGIAKEGLDPRTDERALFYHRLITWVWVPVQLGLIFATLAVIGMTDHLNGLEILGATAALGILTGGVGITYAHELMHQTNRFERALGEILMTSTLYGHFCIEHVYGHHIRVATPDDPASARYGESLWAFLPRTLAGSLRSAWDIQTARMARRGQPVWHYTNPFWRYGLAYAAYFAVAHALAGPLGVALFCLQALVAVVLLEMVNYVEHYGLQRQLLPDGRYERVQPRHSWNASHKLTNLFLINLQRHSDHHKNPQRRYPVLQHYEDSEAPQLPCGYPTMLMLTLVPPLWFRAMNPKVEAWRARHYGAAAAAL
jgi:alkane 1-monooxygenase